MRWAVAILFLASLAGCGSGASILPESADAKAIKEWNRESQGDGGQGIEILEIKKSGPSSAFMVEDVHSREWVQCDRDGRCVPVRFRYPKAVVKLDWDWLFVIKDGKVDHYYLKYKRK